MPKRIIESRWWIWFLIEVIVLVVTSIAGYRLTDKPEIAFTWGLLAFIITVAFHLLKELRDLHEKLDTIGSSLPADVVEHPTFRAGLLANDHLEINLKRDALFSEIALSQIENLVSVLKQLRSGEARVSGDLVYRTYENLIKSLEPGETYKATTFVHDHFWSTRGGDRFLDRNIEAVKRGATVRRVFLYLKHADPEPTKRDAVKMHLAARDRLAAHEKNRFELRILEISKSNIRDMGVLKDTYLMQITSDPYGSAIDACVTTDVNAVRRARQDYDAMYETADPL